jgi:hypothetical protein
LRIDLQTHFKDEGTEKKQSEKTEKTTNTKQNLSLQGTLQETHNDDLDLTMDYNEGTMGLTSPLPTTRMKSHKMRLSKE